VNRRRFIKSTAVLAAAGTSIITQAAPEITKPLASKLPRWRGFNFTEKFVKRREGNPPFNEQDFELLSEWGFNFARLPLSYLCWTEAGPENWLKIREPELKDIDQVVRFGEKHGVHINLNLHRAPGYCVNPPREPLSLWTDEQALDACAFQWAMFAKRYKGIPNERLSFDLLNEPADIAESTYARVVHRLVEAIRAEDRERLIIADGIRWGRDPVFSIADLNIAQSTRGYEPMQISHYKADWIRGSDKWPAPTWPLKTANGDVVDKERIRKERIEPWKKLEQKGVGIHVGEWGAFAYTPHEVVMAWMRDMLDLWKEAGWGWALWNFRGGFGIIDSRRQDIRAKKFRGQELDSEMLELLRAG
jgi:endoglucanase